MRRAVEACPARAETSLQQGQQKGNSEQGQSYQQGCPERPERGNGGEDHYKDVPLGHVRQGTEHAGSGLVNLLEEGAPPGAVVDAPPTQGQAVRQATAVETAGPGDVA